MADGIDQQAVAQQGVRMNSCRTCKHANEKPGHERMHRLGFRNCKHLHESHYVSSAATCRFSPVRWSAKA